MNNFKLLINHKRFHEVWVTILCCFSLLALILLLAVSLPYIIPVFWIGWLAGKDYNLHKWARVLLKPFAWIIERYSDMVDYFDEKYDLTR